MQPLPQGIHSKNVKRIALEVQKEIEEKEKKPVRDIFKIIYKMIRPKMYRAIILKSIENVIIIILSMILRTFVPEVKKPEEERNKVIILICPVLAAIVGFIRYILKEHSAKFVC
jgi:hypothetical protein